MSDVIRPELIEEVAQRLAVSGGMVRPQEHHRKAAMHALEVCGVAMGTLTADRDQWRARAEAAEAALATARREALEEAARAVTSEGRAYEINLREEIADRIRALSPPTSSGGANRG